MNEYMPWVISTVATGLSIVASWLYGDKSWKAPIVDLVARSIWVVYVIGYDQSPLLIPVTINIVLSVRNLIKMRSTNNVGP